MYCHRSCRLAFRLPHTFHTRPSTVNLHRDNGVDLHMEASQSFRHLTRRCTQTYFLNRIATSSACIVSVLHPLLPKFVHIHGIRRDSSVVLTARSGTERNRSIIQCPGWTLYGTHLSGALDNRSRHSMRSGGHQSARISPYIKHYSSQHPLVSQRSAFGSIEDQSVISVSLSQLPT